MDINRPPTALELKDVGDGSTIVVYAPGGSLRQEIEIVRFDEIVDKGEDAIEVKYIVIGDPTRTVHTNEPASLGLAPSHDGEWYRYAIPFNE